MKNLHFIMMALILVAGVTAAPCFADKYTPLYPVHIEETISISDLTHTDSSDSLRLEQENYGIDRARVLLYAGLKEPVVLAEAETDTEEDADYFDEEDEDVISDPIEPFNRATFYFNDKLYLWVINPVAKGYSVVIPEDARVGVRNVFTNVATPIRFVNCILQFKMKSAGNELIRFITNSTIGFLGLFDVADRKLDIKIQDEDFGQTLGVWGLGSGFYINWPVLGPSSVRGSVGLVGDYFLDPVSYVTPRLDSLAIKAGDRVNRTSLVLGQYEDIKKDALDPYSAFKDIYHQYRKGKISK